MQRPTSVTVFGVLNIAFGILGILATAMNILSLAMLGTQAGSMPSGVFNPMSHPLMSLWMKINIPVGIVVNIVLVAAGIGSLRLRPWARKASILYAAFAIFVTIVGVIINSVVMIPMMSGLDPAKPNSMAMMFGFIGGTVGALLGLIYPTLLWYFYTRPHVVAAFEGRWGPNVAEGPITAGASPFAQSLVAAPSSDNPYQAPPAAVGRVIPESGAGESIVETFVPSKNGPALASYYLGLLSLFPLAGVMLGPAAIYFGLKGLRNVRENPAVRGGAHAWVGIICGAIFGLFNMLLATLAAVGLYIGLTSQ